MSSSGPASCAVGNVSMPSRSAARATAIASMRSDFPRSRRERRDVGHQPRRDPDHALAAGDQEPLERARHVPAVLKRPDPLAGRARAPSRSSAPNPRAPTATVFSPSTSPVAASTAAIVCELLCMSAPSTIIDARPLHLR